MNIIYFILCQRFFSQNKIKVVEPRAFRSLDLLSILHLDNNLITELHKNIFKNKTALFALTLERNKIKVIHPELFKGLKSLHILTLDHNEIKEIAPGTFKGLQSLHTLLIEGNKLSRIGEGIFNGTMWLNKLSLQSNHLTSLPQGMFTGLKYVHTLNLHNNSLSHLPDGIFNDMKRLRSLTLHSNNFTYLANKLFTSQIIIKTLSLSNNQLEDLPDFGITYFLARLLLSKNKLQAVPPMRFRALYRATDIFLDNNDIKRINLHAFYGMYSVKTISLLNNPLTVLDNGAFSSLYLLKLVSQDSNTIQISIEILNVDFNEMPTWVSMGYVCKFTLKGNICRPCYRGTFHSISTKECESCPAGGFYQDEMGYSGKNYFGFGCKQCPPGTYVKPEMSPGKSETECKSCEEGTNTKEFAKFRACKCKEGHHRLHRFKPCIFCTKGYVCENDSLDLGAGFYWMWIKNSSQENYEAFKNDLGMFDSPHSILEFRDTIPEAYACPLAESCLGGTKSLCKEGYTGPLCAVCEEGYYNQMSICRKCPTLPWIIGQMCLVLLGLIILVLFIWKQNMKSNVDESRSLTDIVIARLKIVIGFYQVSSSTFGSFSYISWPGPILTLTKYAKMLQLNLLQIVPIDCIDYSIKTDAYTQLIVSVVITALTFIMGMSCKYIIEWYMKKKSFHNEEKQQEKTKQYKYTCYRFVCLIIYITFPLTCSHVFQMLPDTCQKICSYGEHNCKSYLRADYSVECDTTKHKIFGNLSRVALLYCFSLPLIVLRILQKENKKKTSQQHTSFIMNVLRFLYENYSPKCWFWEVVELFRKIFFLAILILLNVEGRTSLCLTAMFSGLYSVLFAHCKPINNIFEHWLQLITLMASSVNFTTGMLLQIPENEISSGLNKEGEGLIITIVLVATNSIVIMVIAVKYISSICTTAVALKTNPKCSFTCCLEILQLVSGAHGEVTNIIDQPQMTKKLLSNIEEKPTGGNLTANIQDITVDENKDDTDITLTIEKKKDDTLKMDERVKNFIKSGDNIYKSLKKFDTINTAVKSSNALNSEDKNTEDKRNCSQNTNEKRGNTMNTGKNRGINLKSNEKNDKTLNNEDKRGKTNNSDQKTAMNPEKKRGERQHREPEPASEMGQHPEDK